MGATGAIVDHHLDLDMRAITIKTLGRTTKRITKISSAFMENITIIAQHYQNTKKTIINKKNYIFYILIK